jgi:hypothetical protein
MRGCGLCQGFWARGKRDTAKKGKKVRGRKTFFPCLYASREEEDAQCSSKQAFFFYI